MKHGSSLPPVSQPRTSFNCTKSRKRPLTEPVTVTTASITLATWHTHTWREKNGLLPHGCSLTPLRSRTNRSSNVSTSWVWVGAKLTSVFRKRRSVYRKNQQARWLAPGRALGHSEHTRVLGFSLPQSLIPDPWPLAPGPALGPGGSTVTFSEC